MQPKKKNAKIFHSEIQSKELDSIAKELNDFG